MKLKKILEKIQKLRIEARSIDRDRTWRGLWDVMHALSTGNFMA
jgi:hypothetical protein